MIFLVKKVIPFCTSGGSTITNSANQLKSTYSNMNWLDGRLIGRSTSQDEIAAWIDSFKYKIIY